MYFMSGSEIVLLHVDNIVPNIKQPRKRFDEQELEELSQSIVENGLLQPITVRPLGKNDYEIIAGERRYRACIMAGITRIPSVIIDSSEERAAILSLTENIQSKKLHFFEEAKAIESLVHRHSYSIDYVASILGKTPSKLSEMLDLLDFSEDIQRIIIDNDLSFYHAQTLLKLSDNDDMTKALETIITENLSAVQSDELIKRILEEKTDKKAKKRRMFFKDLKIFVNTLDHAVETMNKSGIIAEKEQFETDSYIKYTVVISKTVNSI